jgi:hypothetical protein
MVTGYDEELKHAAYVAALQGFKALAESLGVSRESFEVILREVAAEGTTSTTGTSESQLTAIRRLTVKRAARQFKAP